jgi:hypothetical protein
MHRVPVRFILTCVLLVSGACGSLTTTTQRNPYLGYTEEFGVAAQTAAIETGPASGAGAAEQFRRSLTISLRNNHPSAELNASLVVWVNVGSLRSAEQHDALLTAGFKQLTAEVDIGASLVLPVGTYVLNGGGTAGATTVFLAPAQATTGQGAGAAVTPTTLSITIPTPDGALVFNQPPTSCESVAFYYSLNGAPLPAHVFTNPNETGGDSVRPYAGSTGTGAYKTMAQVNVYQCQPLRPGVFFTQIGAERKSNEFLEGENIAFDFNENANTEGAFCIVSFGAAAAATTQPATGTTGQGAGG